MTVRLPLSIANAVDEQRRLGRSNSQIEKIVGLPSGTLSRPWLIDDSEERRRAEVQKEVDEWRERDRRFWARMCREHRQHPQGWRPKGNCLTDKPNAPDQRRVTRRGK